jgi:hypothetical protein
MLVWISLFLHRPGGGVITNLDTTAIGSLFDPWRKYTTTVFFIYSEINTVFHSLSNFIQNPALKMAAEMNVEMKHLGLDDRVVRALFLTHPAIRTPSTIQVKQLAPMI